MTARNKKTALNYKPVTVIWYVFNSVKEIYNLQGSKLYALFTLFDHFKKLWMTSTTLYLNMTQIILKDWVRMDLSNKYSKNHIPNHNGI